MSVPANTVAPAITGTALEGNTLTCSSGTWTGADRYTYQFRRNGGDISGATSSTYAVQPIDRGQSLSCVVTAINSDGPATHASNTVVVGIPSTPPSGGGSGGPETDPVAEADLATHAGLHAAVHGLPSSPTSGHGLVWNGTGWADTDLATQAELDTHAGVKTGVHGLPATPTSGHGLTWNGTDWVDTDLATQAELDAAVLTRAQALVATAVKSGAYTAAPADFVPVDASGASRTVTLPTAPADRTRIEVKVIALSGTNTVTVACGGSDVFNKAGGSTSLTLQYLNQAVLLQYDSAGGLWYVQATDAPIAALGIGVDYKQVLRASGRGTTAAVTGTKYMLAGSVASDSSTISNTSANLAAIVPARLKATEHAIPVKVTKLQISASVFCSTAPAVNITVGLYAVTSTGGNTSCGTLVAGSGVTITTPAANVETAAFGVDFDFPTDGSYMFGYEVSATSSGIFILSASLKRDNV